MNRRTRVFSFVAALLTLSTTAAAFVLLNPPRRWFGDDLARVILVDNAGMPTISDGDSGVGLAVGAAEAWNGVGAGNVIDAQGTSNPTFSLGDGTSTMVFDDPLNVCKGNCLAATFTGFFNDEVSGICGSTGGDLPVVQVFDSDIVFNQKPAGPWNGWTSENEGDGCGLEFFIETVTTHEVGHLLGLGHSDVNDAVMYASVASCVNGGLHSDDIAGLNRLYNCGGSCDPRVEVCAGGADEDCDTLSDSADPECGGGGGCTPADEVCDDGLDNDCDGLTDGDDSDCQVDACVNPGGAVVGVGCVDNIACCSNKCKGKPGDKTCK